MPLFEITPRDLDRLSDREAVDALRKLLWATAFRLGIPISLIEVPSNITSPDGGIDARVSEVVIVDSSELIPVGLSTYQIKTGTFRTGSDADAKKLFCNKDGSLKPQVKKCREEHGEW